MSRGRIFGIVMFVVIAIIIVFIISVTVNRGGKITSGRTRDTKSTTEVKQSVGAIAANPIVYDGLDVKFDANVSDWITKRVFTVADTATGILGTTGASIIVIGDKDFALSTDSTSTALGLGDIAKVFVQGRVTIMDRNQLSQAIGYDLDGPEIALDNNGIIKNWTRGSVIILSSIEKE